jgi:hypothetical protein
VFSACAPAQKSHTQISKPTVSNAKKLYSAVLARRVLVFYANDEEMFGCQKSSWSGCHSHIEECSGLPCEEKLASERKIIADDDQEKAALVANHCPAKVSIGTTIFCVHLLYDLPDNVNSDRWGSQLVYGDHLYIYIGNDNRVRDIQRSN